MNAKLAVVICFLFALLASVSCGPPTPTVATPTPHVLDAIAIVPNAMPGEDDIAVYPGATEVEKYEVNAPLGRSLYFVTPASLDEVYEFYKTTYTGQGWRVNERRITFNDPDFIWADDEGKVPWNVGLGLDVYNDAPSGTRYIVWVSREPEPDNVPIIGGATDIRVSMSDDPIDGIKALDLGLSRVVGRCCSFCVNCHTPGTVSTKLHNFRDSACCRVFNNSGCYGRS